MAIVGNQVIKIVQQITQRKRPAALLQPIRRHALQLQGGNESKRAQMQAASQPQFAVLLCRTFDNLPAGKRDARTDDSAAEILQACAGTVGAGGCGTADTLLIDIALVGQCQTEAVQGRA